MSTEPPSPLPELPPVLGPEPRIAGWRRAVGLLLLAGYVTVPAIMAGSRSPDDEAVLPGTVPRLLMVCGLELGLFTICFALALWLGKLPRRHLLLRWPRTWWLWPRAVGWSLALRLAVGFLLGAVLVIWQMTSGTALQNLDQFRPKVEAMVNVDALRDPLYLFLSLTLVSFVLAGAREELWRAAMIGFLGESFPRLFGGKWGPWLAVFPVALLFGLAHLTQGWMGVAATGVLGIGLGVVMLLHRSVWDAVLAHGFFNATTFAILPLIADHLARRPLG